MHCQSHQPGLELLDIKQALAKYDGLPGHFWTQVDADKDEFTRATAQNLHGGYFIRVAKGAKIPEPVQSCLFLKGDMVIGLGETIDHRLEHLSRIRDLQDATGGFTAFIPWTFQPGNTALSRPEASSVEYLRFLALSRLFLDNVPNIQASWVTQGPRVGQMALFFGANDFGSTMW